jgi:hypothetical protein
MSVLLVAFLPLPGLLCQTRRGRVETLKDILRPDASSVIASRKESHPQGRNDVKGRASRG